MRIFHCPEENKLIILVGLGLIGSEVALLFENKKQFKSESIKIDWTDSFYFKNQFKEILVNLRVEFQHHQTDLVWAAGKAGFGSSTEQCESEHLHFCRFLETVHENSVYFLNRFTVHLLSSAGGLFEGQSMVTKDSLPDPKRPYGFFKLKQEELLQHAFPTTHKIYRPSSVFGKISHGKRLGLIGALIQNGIQNKETVIFGSQDTLRDFIFVENVALSIFKVIQNTALYPDKIFYLVSGRSASIFEIIHLIKNATGKKVLTRFVPVIDPHSICFSPKLNQFDQSDFNFGIRKIISCM